MGWVGEDLEDRETAEPKALRRGAGRLEISRPPLVSTRSHDATTHALCATRTVFDAHATAVIEGCGAPVG